MSSTGATPIKEGKAKAVSTTGVGSKAEGVDIEVMDGLGDRLAALTSGSGKREGHPAAATAAADEETKVANTTSKELEGVGSPNLDDGDESGIDMMTASRGREATVTSSGRDERQAAAENQEDTNSTSKGLQQYIKKEASPSSAPPPPAADIAASSMAEKLDPPSRRFAKYERVLQTPVITTTTSRGWGGEDRGGSRWRGDGSRSSAGGRERSWRRGERGGSGGGRGTRWERGRGQGKGGGRIPSSGMDWLWKYLEEPRGAEQEKYIYYEDELCVVIYDGFPKAKYHLLLMAKGNPVKQPSDLRREHLPSHRRLHDLGKKIAEELSRQGAEAIRCGYHAIPSLEPLHLHIISQHFDSPRLKRPTHWNSFTTDFFLDCSWVEARLEELGSLKLDMTMYRRLEHQPMQCNRCGRVASGMWSLKKHNLECPTPLPGTGGATSSRKKST